MDNVNAHRSAMQQSVGRTDAEVAVAVAQMDFSAMKAPARARMLAEAAQWTSLAMLGNVYAPLSRVVGM